MNCSKCSNIISETNYTGLCAKCAFALFNEAETAPLTPLSASKPASGSSSGISKADMKFESTAAENIDFNHDGELEMIILNGFLNDQYLLGKTMNEGFSVEMLNSKEGVIIFQQIQAVYGGVSHEKVVDPIIIKNMLKTEGLFDAKMESYFKKVLAVKTPQLSQILAYLRILKEQMSLKSLYNINKRISDFLTSQSDDADLSFIDFSAEITKDIRSIQASQAKNDIELVKSQMIEIAQDLSYREQHGERTCLGYDLNPFADMTSAISGLRKGFLYGIAGAPRRGKTTFTLELATLVAANNKVPVLFFTWEQTKKNLTYRLLAKETRINPDTLQRKNIRADKTHNARFAQGWRKMETYMDHLYIIEGSKEDTIDRIKAHAYNAMQDSQCDEVVLVCDYLQKMPLSKAYSDEKFRVEEISTDLKRLSIELNCPIIVISSLNKEGCMIEVTENDEDRPGLYHCKGSGDVEYDLDCAMVMTKAWGDTRELMQQMSHRAEAQNKDPVHVPKIDIIDVYLDKNRDAPEGKSNCVQYFFFIEENRFFELGYKESTNAFRFGKIETLLNQLTDDGFIKYRDIESAPKDADKDKPSLTQLKDGPRRKIRLKRN